MPDLRTSTLIVGLGKIGMGYDLGNGRGQSFLSHARAFSRHPKFRLAGAVDPDSRRRRVFERVYRSPAYPTIEAAMSRQEPELAVVSVPTAIHEKVLVQILASGRPKAVLCEKPLADDPSVGRAMLEKCARKGASLFVNYIRRSEPGAIEVKRRLDTGEISRPIKGTAWYSKGLKHNGSHILNLLEYWLGPIRKARRLTVGRRFGEKDQEPDVHLIFSRGEITLLAAWEESFSHYEIELLSTAGRLRYERGGQTISWQATEPSSRFKGYKTLTKKTEAIVSDMGRYQWHVVEELGKALDGRPAEICRGSEALKTLENITRILIEPCR